MKARHTPMLWVFIPLSIGIITATHLTISATIFAATLLALLTLLYFWQKVILIYPIILCFGGVITSLSQNSLPLDEGYGATLVVETLDGNSGRVIWQRTDQNEWRECNSKVIIWGAEAQSYKTIVVEGDLHPLENSGNEYYQSMLTKGFRSSLRVNKILNEIDERRPPLSVKLNRWATKRLQRLNLRDEAYALAAAVGLAERKLLEPAVIESYNRSGTAHLLALSGLHIGIVMLIISAITYYLPLLRYGHIFADVVSIVAIWLFASMVGLGESVVRAALMFTLLKLSRITSRRHYSLNSLLATMVIILCLDPLALFDLGFILSATAVAAILIIGVPISRRLSSGNALLDALTASLTIGIVASAATIPIISHSFGYVALLSPVTTMPLLLTISAIILTTVLWIILPVTAVAPIFWWIIEVGSTIQNYVVEWFASTNIGFINYTMTTPILVIYYTFMVIIALLTSRFTEQSRDNNERPRTRQTHEN